MGRANHLRVLRPLQSPCSRRSHFPTARIHADTISKLVDSAFNPFTKFQRTIHSLNDSWQTYDIIFHGPRFDASGKLTRPARETVFHNGVLVQDNVELNGPTGHHVRPPYTPGPDKLPLALQDHNHPVRYRNIWIRELNSSE